MGCQQSLPSAGSALTRQQPQYHVVSRGVQDGQLSHRQRANETAPLLLPPPPGAAAAGYQGQWAPAAAPAPPPQAPPPQVQAPPSAPAPPAAAAEAEPPAAQAQPSGAEASPLEDTTKDPDLERLSQLFAGCWRQPSTPEETRAAAAAGVVGAQLVVGRVIKAREEITALCFSSNAGVSQAALTYLRIILENQPIGHSHIACGLFQLTEQFMTNAPPQRFSDMSLDVSMRMVQCVFLLLEAIRAEHLIGNLPAITQEQRDAIWDYAEALRELNVHAVGGANGAVDESADVIAALWLDALVQSAQRLKTPVSKMAEGFKAVAGTVGAAIALYQGDVAAGLLQLKSTFSHNSLLAESWFDELVVLRQLVSGAVKDENLFRQLKWIMSHGELLDSASDTTSRPVFLMHVVLCLERLVLQGGTDFIREESYQLLCNYATSQNPHLQLTAAKALQALGESKEDPKVQATAHVLLQIVVRALMSQSESARLRNYVERMRRQWDAERIQSWGQTGARATAEFRGYTSVISHLIVHLNEGASDGDDQDSLVSMACKVTSHHAARIIEALRDANCFGTGGAEYFKSTTQSGLSLIHEAAKGGIRTNLAWMLASGSEEDKVQLATLISGPDGLQPIHVAGSTEVLDLLLASRASLDVQAYNGKTVLHTLKHPSVLKVAWLRMCEAKGFKLGQEIPEAENPANANPSRPPLCCPRSAAVVDVLLECRASLLGKWEEANGMDPFLAAVEADNADVCSALLEARAEVGRVSQNGRVALHMTGPKALHVLLGVPEVCSQVNAKDSSGYTPLHMANDTQVVQSLIDLKAEVNAGITGQEEFTPLVSDGATLAKVQLLLANGADATAKTSAGDNFFLDSVWKQKLLVVDALLAEVDRRQDLLSMRGTDGREAVLNATLKGDTAMMHLLRISGADLSAINSKSGTMALEDEPKATAYLLAQGVDVNLANSKNGQTLIMREVNRNAPVGRLRELLKMQADPNKLDTNGRSALWWTVRGGSPRAPDYVDALLQASCNPSVSEAGSPLVVAWVSGFQASRVPLSKLLELRCDLNATTCEHRTAASIAAERWTLNDDGVLLFDLLVAARADLLKPDVFGRVPLHWAVQNIRATVSSAVQVWKSCPDAAGVRDMAGESPAELATRLGLRDIAAAITVTPAKSPAPGAAGSPPPPAAPPSVRGRDNVKPGEGEAEDPFFLARMGREEDAIKALADKDIRTMRSLGADGEEVTMLDAALQGGSLGLVKHILGKMTEMAPDAFSRFVQQAVEPPQAEEIYKSLLVSGANYRNLVNGYLTTTKVKLFLERQKAANETPANCWSFPWPVHEPAVVRSLLQLRAAVDASNNAQPPEEPWLDNIRTTAREAGCCEALKVLFEAAPKEKATEFRDAAWQDCARFGGRANMAFLLQLRADVNAVLDDCSALHLATRDMPDIVELLLNARANANAKATSGDTPLHRLGQAEGFCGEAADKVLDLLLRAKADPCALDGQGNPAVFSIVHHKPGVARLVDEGLVPIGIRQADAGKDLAWAAVQSGRSGSLQTLEFLRARGVNILSSSGPDAPNILICAASRHKLQIFDFILQVGRAEPEKLVELASKEDPYEQNLLHLLSGDLDCLRLAVNTLLAVPGGRQALRQMANPKDRATAATPLNTYLRQNDNYELEVLELLLKAGSDVRDSLSSMTYQYHQLAVVDLLIANKADINALVDTQETKAPMLHLMAKNSDLHYLQEWLNRGADLQQRNSEGDSIILCAQVPFMIGFLHDRRVDINFRSPSTGDTLLHYLCSQGSTPIVKFMLVELKAKALKNLKGQSLLHVAARSGHVDTVEFLVNEGFNLEGKDRDGDSPLQVAVRAGQVWCSMVLLKAKADVNATDDGGETALHEAARAGSVHMYNVLVEFKGDPLVQSKTKQTILHKAAKMQHQKMVEVALRTGLQVNLQSTNLGLTALHYAVKSQQETIVKMLVSARVDQTLADKRGETALDMAAQGGVHILKVLVESNNYTPFHLARVFLQAVMASNRLACEYLVQECGVTIQGCMDPLGNNALHLVAQTGDDELARWLMDTWGDSNLVGAMCQRNRERQTPGDIADMRDHERVQRAFAARTRKMGVILPEFPEVEVEHQSYSCCFFGDQLKRSAGQVAKAIPVPVMAVPVG